MNMSDCYNSAVAAAETFVQEWNEPYQPTIHSFPQHAVGNFPAAAWRHHFTEATKTACEALYEEIREHAADYAVEFVGSSDKSRVKLVVDDTIHDEFSRECSANDTWLREVAWPIWKKAFYAEYECLTKIKAIPAGEKVKTAKVWNAETDGIEMSYEIVSRIVDPCDDPVFSKFYLDLEVESSTGCGPFGIRLVADDAWCFVGSTEPLHPSDMPNVDKICGLLWDIEHPGAWPVPKEASCRSMRLRLCDEIRRLVAQLETTPLNQEQYRGLVEVRECILKLFPVVGTFHEAYDRLSGYGTCDSPGGAEYWRVFHEWLAAGSPADCHAFIKKHANEVPLPEDVDDDIPSRFEVQS